MNSFNWTSNEKIAVVLTVVLAAAFGIIPIPGFAG